MTDLHAPPIEWFSRPADLVPGNGLEVTDEGRVSGYLCLWNARFVNGGRGNVRPPRGSDYAFANAFTSKATQDDGSVVDVRVGVIAGSGGHRFKDGFADTQNAYGNIDTKFARVVYGEDRHGVWFSGAIMPDTTAEQVTAARASGVSGHWEKPTPSGKMELLGSVLVNLPAFAQAAQHRIAASATIEATDAGGFVVTPSFQKADLPKLGDRVSLDAAPQALTAAGQVQAPISGRLLSLNTETVDGRIIEQVEWTSLPLPLYWGDAQSHGHMGSTVVGRIDEVTVDGDEVTFTGVLDQAFLQAQGAKDVADLNVLGISIDGAATGDVEAEYDDDNDGWWPDRIRFTLMQILGATLTSMPAFHGTLGVTAGEFTSVEDDSPDTPDMPEGEDGEDGEDEDVTATAATIRLPREAGSSDLRVAVPIKHGN